MKNILGLILLFSLNLSFAQKTIVKTQNGTVQGELNSSKDISIFKGIPFAQPPVGNLRWKAPQAPKNWNGVLKCTTFSASPMQAFPKPFMCWSEEFIAQPEPLSED
jgi:para-nitrobenzyl esterase